MIGIKFRNVVVYDITVNCRLMMYVVYQVDFKCDVVIDADPVTPEFNVSSFNVLAETSFYVETPVEIKAL